MAKTNGKRNRQAGHAYERQVVNELKKLGFPNAVSSRSESKNMDDKGVDICNTGDWLFQCKNSKTNPNYAELLATMPDQDDPGRIQVILHKKTKKSKRNFIPVGEYAILKKDHFYKLLQRLYLKI